LKIEHSPFTIELADNIRFIALSGLLSLAVLSCFSYPFQCPFTWLKFAASVCPGRFIPLSESAKLYKTDERHEDVLIIARQVINKKIEIPSATVTAIKNAMRQLLEKGGKRDSATQGGTGNEPKSHEPRQGETPEVSPHGSALPP
jgi:hypothetical protein